MTSCAYITGAFGDAAGILGIPGTPPTRCPPHPVINHDPIQRQCDGIPSLPPRRGQRELARQADLFGEGEEGGVLGVDLAGKRQAGVMEFQNLLELGNSVGDMGLEAGEEGDDVLGRGGGGGRGGEDGWEGAAEGGEPVGAVVGDVEEHGSEGGHPREEGLGAGS